MKATTFQIGDVVVLTRQFLRSTGCGPTSDQAHRVGPIVGLGSTATTWHCGACAKELGIMAPTKGREVFTPPQASPCCNAMVTVKEHVCSAYSLKTVVRVQWKGDAFETAINVANIAKRFALRAHEDLPAEVRI